MKNNLSTEYRIKLNPTTGAPLGQLNFDKLEGGLKKGAVGMPAFPKNKK